jgi:hypothetical protein
LRFTVLGPLRARRGETELDLGSRQMWLTVALSLTSAGQFAGAGDVVGLLRGMRPPAPAVDIVHRHIGALRRLWSPTESVVPVRCLPSEHEKSRQGLTTIDRHD